MRVPERARRAHAGPPGREAVPMQGVHAAVPAQERPAGALSGAHRGEALPLHIPPVRHALLDDEQPAEALSAGAHRGAEALLLRNIATTMLQRPTKF